MITGTSVLSSAHGHGQTGTHPLVIKSLVCKLKIAIISENFIYGRKSAYF